MKIFLSIIIIFFVIILYFKYLKLIFAIKQAFRGIAHQREGWGDGIREIIQEKKKSVEKYGINIIFLFYFLLIISLYVIGAYYKKSSIRLQNRLRYKAVVNIYKHDYLLTKAYSEYRELYYICCIDKQFSNLYGEPMTYSEFKVNIKKLISSVKWDKLSELFPGLPMDIKWIQSDQF